MTFVKDQSGTAGASGEERGLLNGDDKRYEPQQSGNLGSPPDTLAPACSAPRTQAVYFSASSFLLPIIRIKQNEIRHQTKLPNNAATRLDAPIVLYASTFFLRSQPSYPLAFRSTKS